jgi:NTE family protein
VTRVSLALSGGGAAGLGHIPVIEALDDAGIRPVAVSGSSMGAVIGACVAAGMSGAEIRDHVLDLVSDLPALGAQMVKGTKWADLGLGLFLDPERILSFVLPKDLPERIEELPVPFTAVATDYYRQCEVCLTEGPLVPALAASMAIPGVFRPVKHAGRVLVDGGVCNNLPIGALPEDCAVVAVDVVTNPPDETSTDIPGPLATTLGSMRIMMRALLERRLQERRPEVLIRPASSRFGPLDFNRAEEIFEAAAPARDEARAELKRLTDAAA